MAVDFFPGPAVRAGGLTKRYRNGITAVDGVDFVIERGECVGILGPNGAGKSSIVRMIYGFSPLTSGELRVLGIDVQKYPAKVKARIGVVPQEDYLDPELTVEENLHVYATYYNLYGEEVKARVTGLLGTMDLLDYRREPVETLSGGMKRRLSIIRAIVHDPELLVLDEPTSGLDPHARFEVWGYLRKLREKEVTLILTTHYLEEASSLCDRVIIVDKGKILEEGKPDRLISTHIGSEVMEVSWNEDNKRHEEEFLAGLDGGKKHNGYRWMGSVLYIFLDRDRSLLPPLEGKCSYLRVRQATLEDVFLKLTGREID